LAASLAATNPVIASHRQMARQSILTPPIKIAGQARNDTFGAVKAPQGVNSNSHGGPRWIFSTSY
jgi:hypothetical protein